MKSQAAVPNHVAIIPDGNRRWARERGLELMEGHRRAYERSFELVELLASRGVKYVTVYAFSTENWKRAKDEVGFLVGLLERFVAGEFKRLANGGYCLRFVGSTEGLGKKLSASMRSVEEQTKHNSRMMLSMCFNYGGRRDLVEAVRSIVREGVPAGDVDEALIARHLSTHGLPDPDLILRTSGEQRLSNFLLFEGAYAELMFFDLYWPDFGEREIEQALAEYARRARRYGS